jgi:hypothetical protein
VALSYQAWEVAAMKRDELMEIVGREPLFTTGMLLGP